MRGRAPDDDDAGIEMTPMGRGRGGGGAGAGAGGGVLGQVMPTAAAVVQSSPPRVVQVRLPTRRLVHSACADLERAMRRFYYRASPGTAAVTCASCCATDVPFADRGLFAATVAW